MEDFQKVLEKCRLSDMGFQGSKFTWTNGRTDNAFTQERLDRAVANAEWLSHFACSEVKVMARRNSDHNPLLLCFDGGGVRRRAGRPFHFEANWESYPDFKKEVGKSWRMKQRGENPLQNVHGKLQSCKRSILRWVKKTVHVTEDLIRSKTKKLEEIQGAEGDINLAAEQALMEEVNELLEQEETKWRQRAKENWLIHGDCNTKFFHACATQWRTSNTISQIVDGNGQA
ncbi:uncharacterized protein LOC132162402 [Corylus avellana]|uniref:uncharacterized protein LOC132162402 n=1 Tax=Corylus avellana TaxID=13451 RepID=UPI00286A3CA1|nr:uncharacterized protein LOC132162402 [Corylus avellana]